MKRFCGSVLSVPLFAFACLVSLTWMMGCGQQTPLAERGMVDDWSTHHTVFSDPGTKENAIKNGRYEAWQRIVTSRRYQMQQLKRKSKWAAQLPPSESIVLTQPESDPSTTLVKDNAALPDTSILSPRSLMPTFPRSPIRSRHPVPRAKNLEGLGLWTVPLTQTTSSAMAAGVYPAKYTFDPITTPNCNSDYVVYPVNQPGSTTQANLVGFNNLYVKTCLGTVPAVAFAYDVGSGTVQTSPVLSTDGTQVAFIESVQNGSVFHVLKLGTTGSNGTAWNTPAVPGSGNNAVDQKVTIAPDTHPQTGSSGGVSITRSSIFVDYEDDVAWVGDDNGFLHEFTPVFNGPPQEVVNSTGAAVGWPYVIQQTAIQGSPTYDGVSQTLLIGDSVSNITCMKPFVNGGQSCPHSSAYFSGAFNPIQDAPLVDSTNQTAFVVVNDGTAGTTTNNNPNYPNRAQVGSAVVQVQLSNIQNTVVWTSIGAPVNNLYDGTFDNAYFTNGPASGFLYLCGALPSAATPALVRVGFNSSGVMNSTTDGNSFQLAATGDTGNAYDCSPLTENYNSNNNTDLLFLSVVSGGAPAKCNGLSCMMSFDITNEVFPTAPQGALQLAPGGITFTGTGGIIIDGTSTSPGAAQIYFGLQNYSLGYQASQSGLQ